MDRAKSKRYKISMNPSLILILIILLGSSSIEARASKVSREFLPSNEDRGKVEFFWSKPEGVGPFPVLLLIHPEQESPKTGGKMFVESGQVDYWVGKGYVSIAISQPGYGKSEGSPDFCGPKTQSAVADILKHFQFVSGVDPQRMFLYGGSRGAVVASRVAANGLPLAGVILKSGVYDFVEWSRSRPWYDVIKLTMLWELGWLSDEKLKERSAVRFADKIKAPVLVIHGSQDYRAPLNIAENFVKKVNDTGGKAKLIVIESEHVIPMPQVVGYMDEFMKAY